MSEEGTTRRRRLGEWFDVIYRLLGRRIPRPPRLVHEEHIRTYMARAYYAVLNDDQDFQRELLNLLSAWSERDAEQFARRWPLPKRGIADLGWTYSLWRRRFLKEPRLHIGSRSYPGLEQAGEQVGAQRLGYRPHPPRLKDKRSLQLGALRLYRRAVLEWPWEKIAAAEAEELRRPEDLDIKSAWDGVHRWAKALGVPLPQVPRGRPPSAPKSES